jgi:zinc dependent phospholipase C
MNAVQLSTATGRAGLADEAAKIVSNAPDAVATRRSTRSGPVPVVVLAFVVGFALPARIVSRDLLLVMGGVVAVAIRCVLCQSRSHLHDSQETCEGRHFRLVGPPATVSFCTPRDRAARCAIGHTQRMMASIKSGCMLTRTHGTQLGRRWLFKLVIVGTMVFAALCVPRRATAYSVLAHEANIDALWDTTIKPMLQARFPEATPEQLLEARAYAYGGCVIQDLGYYPFGSHFFSNLLHYVRTGDFVDALIREAQDIDEYAFALGALGHYAADNSGHPMAVNRVVPLMYPKLKAEFGNNVTYVQSPKSHVLVEFSFDVVQVAAGAYAPEAYHRYIGFKVAKPALERAFHDTYGIEMKDVFLSEDLAIATYRHAVGTTIPEMTKVAWGKKRDQIMKVTPGMQRKTFVFKLPRKQYDKDFGGDYAKPHGFARFIAVVYNLVPKIGPFRSLSFSVPTPEAERLFLESFTTTTERFRQSLDALRAGRLRLPNTDFDTGRLTTRGEYSLADDTYDQLLDKLAGRRFADVPAALSANMVAYYGAADPLPGATADQQKQSTKIQLEVRELAAVTEPPGP